MFHTSLLHVVGRMLILRLRKSNNSSPVVASSILNTTIAADGAYPTSRDCLSNTRTRLQMSESRPTIP